MDLVDAVAEAARTEACANEGHPDHQRASRVRGPARVADHVAAGEPSQGLDGHDEPRGQCAHAVAGDRRGQGQHADHQCAGAEADQCGAVGLRSHEGGDQGGPHRLPRVQSR